MVTQETKTDSNETIWALIKFNFIEILVSSDQEKLKYKTFRNIEEKGKEG
jgi:hypothetical protein